MKLISQGAEAKIFQDKKTIIKDRTPKSYRHPDLDKKIRTRRTKAESRILQKAKEAKINVPKILNLTTNYQLPTTNKFHINMEFISGDRLSQTLNSYPKQKQNQIMKKLGTQVSNLHKNNIIHADLTTSNVILKTDRPQSKVYLIDFGLSYISTKIEDKAVDLHLLKQALQAKHFPMHETLFQNFLTGYKSQDSPKILNRLKTVESRGRYKKQ